MEKPLVSIAVGTFNSSKYVLDTLFSIYNQTYQNIELIISDDCSTDDTVKVCSEWLRKYSTRFVRTQLLTVPQNTGIPANHNRYVKAAKGEWFKSIAGDDLLLPNCIENFISNVDNDTEIIIGGIKPFSIDQKGGKKYGKMMPFRTKRYFFKKDSTFQYRYLLSKSFNFAPGAFFRLSVFEKYGYYDEEYRFIEDLPYWIKYTSQGGHLTFLNKPCVQYRTQHESSVFSNKNLYNVRFYECLFSFHRQVIWKNVPWWNFSYYETIFITMLVYKVGVSLFHNRNSRLFHRFKDIMERLKISEYYINIYDYFKSKSAI